MKIKQFWIGLNRFAYFGMLLGVLMVLIGISIITFMLAQGIFFSSGLAVPTGFGFVFIGVLIVGLSHDLATVTSI